MTLKNMTRGKRVYTEEKVICYYWRDMPDAGFSFPADEDWQVDTDNMSEAALVNLAGCTSGEFDVNGPFRETYRHSHWEAGTGECQCGQTVHLTFSLVNPCACGREYNSSGQELASREQWGWDTGETVSEIMQGNLPMGGSK